MSSSNGGWYPGEVRATEEVFHVVDVTEYAGDDYYSGRPTYRTSPRCMNKDGRWMKFRRDRDGRLIPDNGKPNPVTVKKGGWFSREERVFRQSWLDDPLKPDLDNILKRAAELLIPTA